MKINEISQISKSLWEINKEYVQKLMESGETTVQPKGKPFKIVKGYDKTKGLKSCGSIFKNKDEKFELLQDMYIDGDEVKWENLGLCDSKCWYEALDEDQVKKESQEQERLRKEDEERQLLKDLTIHSLKELGEIAEVLVRNNKPSHWKNELGDLCGLCIMPMLELAKMDFESACKLGIERKRSKMK